MLHDTAGLYLGTDHSSQAEEAILLTFHLSPSDVTMTVFARCP